MNNDTKALFSPKDIKGLLAKNRFAVAPMTRVSATEDGRATETMARYYERFARGGFGTVISEGIYTDKAYSQAYLHQPGLADTDQAVAWSDVVSRINAHGSLAIAQLMHAGAISQGNRYRDHTVGPSAVQPKGTQLTFYYGKDRYAVPWEITEDQIADAISGFAEAADRAVHIAGFDALEVHGANGYLLDQFLSDCTNRRTDRWGGSLQRRLQMTLETIKAVRAKVGNSIPIGVRISQGKVNDFHHKWLGGEAEAETIFGSLSDIGADFIHVTEFEAWQPAFSDVAHSLVHLAKRYAPNATVIANGGLDNIEMATRALGEGADMVAIAKGALANPDLPSRVSAGIALKSFDPSILGPIANIKESELTA